MNRSNRRFTITFLILLLFLAVIFWCSFFVGRFSMTAEEIIDILSAQIIPQTKYWQDTLQTIVLEIRLPRIVLGILVGGALSVSGASYQTLFKNPMVSPDILGVSAGAGFGAALAMIRQGTWWQIQVSALICGLLAVLLSYLIGAVVGQQSVTILILAGMVISSLFQALLSVLKTLADPENTLPSITFWLMGSLGKASMRDVLIMLPAVVMSLTLIYLFRHQINVLASGEEEAATMGVNVPFIKGIVVLCATLLTVSAVSISGIIGWVGMVVPHIARMLVGADYPKLCAVSFLIGGSFLLLIDNIVRGIPGAELPLGVLTALIGTPIFALLLVRVRKGWV